MDCSRCSALLPPKSNICKYCGAVNDTDLKGIRVESNPQGDGHRQCPRCNCSLEAIAVATKNKILIDRCRECLGVFFDLGELETIMTEVTDNIFEIDRMKLNKLLSEEGIEKNWPVVYLKCPDCENLMNREILGAASGILIDKCRNHGIWLDGGELGRALKWFKAGGKDHCNNVKEKKRIAEELKRAKAKDKAKNERKAVLMSTTKFSTNEISFFDLLEWLSNNK